jgi:hypothetical protein
MAKPRRLRGPTITIFPFLSVLSCLIGILILMIASLSIPQKPPIIPPGPGDVTVAEEEIAKLKQQIEKADRLLAEVESARKELKGINDDQDATQKSLILVGKIGELGNEQQYLKTSIAKLKGSIDDLNEEKLRRGQAVSRRAITTTLEGKCSDLLQEIQEFEAHFRARSPGRREGLPSPSGQESSMLRASYDGDRGEEEA